MLGPTSTCAINTAEGKERLFTYLLFSSDSPQFLHVALNSFRKCCSNVLSAVLRCVLYENRNLAHNHRFLLQMKHIKAADKT